MKFNIFNEDECARVGELHFSRGIIQTPVFMPVGTYGTVKTMTPDELLDLGAEIVLGNLLKKVKSLINIKIMIENSNICFSIIQKFRF